MTGPMKQLQAEHPTMLGTLCNAHWSNKAPTRCFYPLGRRDRQPAFKDIIERDRQVRSVK
jgi:hypothetical protein